MRLRHTAAPSDCSQPHYRNRSGQVARRRLSAGSKVICAIGTKPTVTPKTLKVGISEVYDQWPSARAETTAAKLQTGMPCSAPFSPAGFPSESYSCHASEPPFFQPVPSVQTSIVLSREFPVIAGCLRFPVVPGRVGLFAQKDGEKEGVKSRGGLLRVIVVQYLGWVRHPASMRAGKGGAHSRQKFQDGPHTCIQR
jgi:hypothetical protein